MQNEPWDVPEVDGEEGRGEVAYQPTAQPEQGAGGAPEVRLDPGCEERLEEAEALDVVHVEMGEEHVHAPE